MSKMIKNNKKAKYIGMLFVLPWLVGFLIFSLYPLASSLYYSFTNYHMSSGYHFVGGDNYLRMFTRDINFYHSLKITFYYAAFSVVFKLILALAVALLLNMKLKLIGIYRTVFYLPSIFGGSVAIAVLWKMLFAYNGLINKLLSTFSINPVEWLSSSGIALYTIGMVNVWMFGSSMIIFLAAIKSIPDYLYEAARIDGAGKLRRFVNITIPQITPVILFNLVMQIINAFQDFTAAFVVPASPGDPAMSTYLFSIHIYQSAFANFEMGYASALSWILFVIILFFTALILKTSRKWVFYAGE